MRIGTHTTTYTYTLHMIHLHPSAKKYVYALEMTYLHWIIYSKLQEEETVFAC